jgi:hypothetical protein
MSEVVRRRSYGHLIYALVSFACPFIAFAIIDIYQSYEYADFWEPRGHPIEDTEIYADALLAIVIVAQAMLAVAIGSLIGLVFAGLSLKKRLRFFSFGTAAFVFNAIPVGFVVMMYVRGHW